MKEHNLYTFVENHPILVMEYDDHVVRSSHEVAKEIQEAMKGRGAGCNELGDIGGNALLGRVRAAVRQQGVQILVSYPERIMVGGNFGLGRVGKMTDK